MYVCAPNIHVLVQCPKKLEDSLKLSHRQSYAAMWKLEIEYRSFGRTSSALNH